MARKKRAKKVTVNELQSYITGAIEFNDDDWHPDKTQWEKIVEMIMNVKEEPPQQVVQNIQGGQSPQPGGRAAPPPGAVAAPPEGSNMSLDAPAGGNPEFDDRPEPTRMTSGPVPVVEQVGAPNSKDPETGTFSSGKKFKTPNVDTSKGDYKSGFA